MGNIKEVCENLAWDLIDTGISLRWKEHQSVDSNAQVLLMNVPQVHDKLGIEMELNWHLQQIEKKLIRKGKHPSTYAGLPLPEVRVTWRQNKQGKGKNKVEKELSMNTLVAFQENGCTVCTVEASEGQWPRLAPLFETFHNTDAYRRAFGRYCIMVVLFNGRPTDGDRVTMQRLRRLNVTHAFYTAFTIIPSIACVHKSVEIQVEEGMVDEHKYTDICREVQWLRCSQDKPLFDAITPIESGYHKGCVILTYRSDNKEAAILARKIRTDSAGWFFGYWRQVKKYRLNMVQKLMECFEYDDRLLASAADFDPVTLTVQARFHDNEADLDKAELAFGIDQEWIADDEGVTTSAPMEGMEMMLRDKIDDVDDADRSGPSRRSDYDGMSSGNSTLNSSATCRKHTHKEKALKNIELINANDKLTNALHDKDAEISALLDRLKSLSQPLSALEHLNTPTAQSDTGTDDQNETMHDRGCSNEVQKDDVPYSIRGGCDEQYIKESDCQDREFTPIESCIRRQGQANTFEGIRTVDKINTLSSSRALNRARTDWRRTKECRYQDMIDGIWPGNEDQQLLAQFIRRHFAKDLEGYGDFKRWLKTKNKDSSCNTATVSLYLASLNKERSQTSNAVPRTLEITQLPSPLYHHHDKSPTEGDSGRMMRGEEEE